MSLSTTNVLFRFLGLFHQQWMERTHNEPIRIVTDSIDSNIPESTEQKTAVLYLARNVFVCKVCEARELFYPEVLAHDCCTRPPPYPPRTVLSDLERRCTWNSNCLSQHETLTTLMTILTMAVGLDAETATVRDIDTLEHYYQCLICQRANLGSGGFKNIYGWRSFVVNPLISCTGWLILTLSDSAHRPSSLRRGRKHPFLPWRFRDPAVSECYGA